MSIKKIIQTAALLLASIPFAAFAQTPAPPPEPPAQAAPAPGAPLYFPAQPEPTWYMKDYLPPQHFTLKDEIFMAAGYRFVQTSGTHRASEYDYLHPSPAGALRLHVSPLPFRFDVDAYYLNENDHDADVSVRFTDMVKLDMRSTELFHNMDHYRFLNVAAVDADPDARYGVDVNDGEIRLTLKSPGLPYHVYANYREYRKDGTIQQRWQPDFRNGDAKVSESRDIDWVTEELTAGINGNVLGLFEVDYHHTIKAFDSKLRGYMVDAMLIPPAVMAHNLVPNLETNFDVLSIHTDQSKRLTAAGTFERGHKKNKFSQAKVDLHREYGDVTWRPFDKLAFSIKYGHERLQTQNPDVLTRPLPFNVAPPVAVVKDVITRTVDRAAASAVFVPHPKINLLAQYRMDRIERTNAADFTLAEELNVSKGSSVTHTGKVTLSLFPIRHTRIKGSFKYAYNGDPSYIVDYQRLYEGYVWASYVPMPGLILDANYKITRGENPVRTENTDFELVDELDRRVHKDTASAGVTWFAMRDLTLGAHYDFIRNKTKQTILYEDAGGELLTAQGAPYWDVSNGYTVFARVCFPFPLTLEGDFSQNWSRGGYRVDDTLTGPDPAALPTNTDEIEEFTAQQIRTTAVRARAEYEIYRGWGIALGYGMNRYNTTWEITRDSHGTAHFVTAMLTKRWI